MGKKFIASYSGGKDSILAIHRAIQQGMTPIALITTYNTDKERSWFHGLPQPVLESISQSLGIPIWLIKTSGEDYTVNFERALSSAKALGAEVCVFGDIDIQAHNDWCSERCHNVGLEPCFPLWGEARSALVYEFIDSGFTTNITVVDTKRMNPRFLGEKLTRKLVDEIAGEGVDICGENGEYHTFASGGPLFHQPVTFSFGEPLTENHYAILPIV